MAKYCIAPHRSITGYYKIKRRHGLFWFDSGVVESSFALAELAVKNIARSDRDSKEANSRLRSWVRLIPKTYYNASGDRVSKDILL